MKMYGSFVFFQENKQKENEKEDHKEGKRKEQWVREKY